MAEKSDSFKGIMSLFATGVTVVTTNAVDGEFYGLTVNSFTSVSLDPQLILICLDNRISGIEKFDSESLFAVNILADDQEELSTHFATPGTDRSEATGLYDVSRDGTPLLKECLGAMECRPVDRHPGGDHTILVAEVVSVHLGTRLGETGPLLYYRGRYSELADKVAPSWIASTSRS